MFNVKRALDCQDALKTNQHEMVETKQTVPAKFQTHPLWHCGVESLHIEYEAHIVFPTPHRPAASFVFRKSNGIL